MKFSSDLNAWVSEHAHTHTHKRTLTHSTCRNAETHIHEETLVRMSEDSPVTMVSVTIRSLFLTDYRRKGT